MSITCDLNGFIDYATQNAVISVPKDPTITVQINGKMTQNVALKDANTAPYSILMTLKSIELVYFQVEYYDNKAKKIDTSPVLTFSSSVYARITRNLVMTTVVPAYIRVVMWKDSYENIGSSAFYNLVIQTKPISGPNPPPNPPPPPTPTPTQKYQNSAFIDYNRYYSDTTNIDAKVIAYVKQLDTLGFSYQYVDGGLLTNDGHFEAGIQELMPKWISLTKATVPTQKVIFVINTENYELMLHPTGGSTTFMDNFLSDLKIFIKNCPNIDGINLDIESLQPYFHDDLSYFSMLQKVRAVIGPNKELIVCAPIWTITWSNAYLSRLATVLDGYSVMLYDSGGNWTPAANSVAEYVQLWKTTVQRYSDAVLGTKCQVVPIAPCYSKRATSSGVVYHNPSIENIFNSVTGLNQALNAGAKIFGLSVFWYPNLIQTRLDKDGHDYTQDKNWWITEWLKQ